VEARRIFFTNVFLLEDNSKGNKSDTKDLKLEVSFRKRTEIREQSANAQGLHEVIDKNIVERLKEENLDEMFPGEEGSQNMIEWIWQELEPYAELVNCELYKVALWDTSASKVELIK